MATPKNRFWENRSLEEFSKQEWESLCDGCGRCCLIKIEDENSHELYYTSVVCRYHDSVECRCTCYVDRSRLVPDCIRVTPAVARTEAWLPETCAYRLLAEGKPLYAWHPLISGTRESVHSAGISVRDQVVSEEYIHTDDVIDHVVELGD